jgi:hypothetical protein
MGETKNTYKKLKRIHRKQSFWRTRSRINDNIKIDAREEGFNNVNCT